MWGFREYRREAFFQEGRGDWTIDIVGTCTVGGMAHMRTHMQSRPRTPKPFESVTDTKEKAPPGEIDEHCLCPSSRVTPSTEYQILNQKSRPDFRSKSKAPLLPHGTANSDACAPSELDQLT